MNWVAERAHSHQSSPLLSWTCGNSDAWSDTKYDKRKILARHFKLLDGCCEESDIHLHFSADGFPIRPCNELDGLKIRPTGNCHATLGSTSRRRRLAGHVP